MRLGIIAPPLELAGWSTWAEAITRADTLGIDAVYLPAASGVPAGADSLLAAAALAARTRWLRVVAEVAVSSDLHPVHLAERIAVADQCLGGRLGVALSCADSGLLAETLTVLELSLASLPFSYQGTRWTIPARLPANDAATWSRVTVTPAPAQPDLPLWLTGPGARSLAQERDRVWLAGPEDDPAPFWSTRTTPRSRPALRPWTLTPGGTPDPIATATALATDRDTWSLGLAFLPLADPTGTEIEHLAHRVRPRIQLADLPPGLEHFWTTTHT